MSLNRRLFSWLTGMVHYNISFPLLLDPNVYIKHNNTSLFNKGGTEEHSNSNLFHDNGKDVTILAVKVLLIIIRYDFPLADFLFSPTILNSQYN